MIYIKPSKDRLVSGNAHKNIQNVADNFQLISVKGGHFILQAKHQECWDKINNLYDEHHKNLLYHFEETLKLLVILSSPSEVQYKAYQFINPEEEIANDLLFHFVEYHKEFIEHQLIEKETADEILKIDRIFSLQSPLPDNTFWTDIETAQAWQNRRHQAKAILFTSGEDRTRVEIDSQQVGTGLSYAKTQIRLIR